MKELTRYLIKRKGKSGLLEIGVLEVAKNAIKIVNLVKEESNGFLSFSSRVDEPYWILKTEIDEIGQTEYYILEELGPMPISNS